MKIGIDARHLTEALSGIPRYMIELTRELARQGHSEYVLYAPRPPDARPWAYPSVTLRAAAVRGRAGRFLWSQTTLPWWAWRDGVDVFWGPFRIPRRLPRTVATVITIHDLVWKYFGETMQPHRRWIESKLMPAAIRTADRIVAVSSATAQAIDAEYPESRGRVRVVHPGATALAAPAERSSLARFGIDRPHFLFVGTLEPRKNLPRLLRAYASLDAGARGRAMLVIAGAGGWGKVDIARLVNELNLSRDVALTGYISDADLAALYANARFLAMPSIYEGFGSPIVEAMAFGVPVLTSNSSSMPEVAGDAALLVDPLDESAIARGLHTLILNDERRAELAALARPNAARQMHAVFVEARADRRLPARRTSLQRPLPRQ